MAARDDTTFNSMKKYRDASDILYKMLKHVVSESRTKTEIMFEARMSYAQMLHYMELLIGKGLIKLSGDKKNRGTRYADTYNITPKGLEVIQVIEKLRELLQ